MAPRSIVSIVLLLTLTLVASSGAAAQTPLTAQDIDLNGLFATDAAVLAPAPEGIFPAGSASSMAEVGRALSTDGSEMLVVLRNNTQEEVNQVGVSARILEGDRVVALGASSTLTPSVVLPNGIGLVVLPFSDPVDPQQALSADVRIEAATRYPIDGYEPVDVIDAVVEDDAVLVGITSRGQGGLSAVAEDLIVVCVGDPGSEPLITDFALYSLSQETRIDRAVTVGVPSTNPGCDGTVIAGAVGTAGAYIRP